LLNASIKKLDFVKNSKDKNIENTGTNSDADYLLVLDGQQRLTAFYIVLKGNYIIRNKPYDLYFDIRSGNEELEEGVLYEFQFFNKNNGKCFQDGNHLWYRVKDVYDIQGSFSFSISNAIAKSIKETVGITLENRHLDNMQKLWACLRYEKIIYYYPEVAKDYDKVLDVFIRTNSGGTKLSHSDLLFSNIKLHWQVAREKFQKLLDDINDGDDFDFDNDFILKTALLIYASNNEGVRYKINNFKPEFIVKLQEDWDRIESSIRLTIDLLKTNFFLTSKKTIPSHNAIIPIVYWIFRTGKKGVGVHSKQHINTADVENIRVWVVKALLSGIFGGQSDAVLYKCKQAIDEHKGITFPAKDIEDKIGRETKKELKLSPDFLDEVAYNSKYSYLVLSVAYRGAINFKPKMKGNLPEQDHIFSQNELETAGISSEKINSIYNIRYLGSSDNKSKSDTPFADWTNAVDKNELNKHLVPNGSWDISSFDAFLKARGVLLKSIFDSYLV